MNKHSIHSSTIPAAERDLSGWFAVFVRGLAMGIAEVIPGVSGGTIAFISGIYTELLTSIAALGAPAILDLFNKGPLYFWHRYNLSFLALLFLGMACSIVLFAKLVLFLLANYGLHLWGFFFGLICVSVVVISRQARLTHLLSLGLIGILFGAGLALSSAASLEPTPATLFVAGMLAVSAWILPGVSGSYLLLVLGLYSDVLHAVDSLDYLTLGLLGSGCAVGLLVFSRLLSWLLNNWHSGVMAMLSGFTAGSLIKLWPWQVVSKIQGSMDQSTNYLLPWNYTQLSGEAAQIPGVLFFVVLGAALVLFVNRLTQAAPSRG